MPTIAASLTRSARRRPYRTALVFLDRTYTYREFGEAVNRAAHALAGQRLRRVDRMLLMSGNSDGYVIAFYAAMKLGALPRKIPKHVLRTDLRQAPEAPNV